MTNALAGKQPKNATLTALAGLSTAKNKLPYFAENDAASLTELTQVGRDILAKNSVADVLEYLGPVRIRPFRQVRRSRGHQISFRLATS